MKDNFVVEHFLQFFDQILLIPHQKHRERGRNIEKLTQPFSKAAAAATSQAAAAPLDHFLLPAHNDNKPKTFLFLSPAYFDPSYSWHVTTLPPQTLRGPKLISKAIPLHHKEIIQELKSLTHFSSYRVKSSFRSQQSLTGTNEP